MLTAQGSVTRARRGKASLWALSWDLFGPNDPLWNGVGLLLGHFFGPSFVYFDLIVLIKFLLFYFFVVIILYFLFASIYLLFANIFCLLKFTENNKKRKSETSTNRCCKSYFWYELDISRVLGIHA